MAELLLKLNSRYMAIVALGVSSQLPVPRPIRLAVIAAEVRE